MLPKLNTKPPNCHAEGEPPVLQDRFLRCQEGCDTSCRFRVRLEDGLRGDGQFRCCNALWHHHHIKEEL